MVILIAVTLIQIVVRFLTPIYGQLIFNTDANFSSFAEQYAYTSFQENIAPSMIVFAECDNDIKAVLKYASNCDYHVMIRQVVINFLD